MAVSDLITSIRYQLHDTNANNWTGAEILDYINRGHRLIWTELIKHKSDLVRKATTASTVAGTETYALPSDFYAVDFLQLDDEEKPLSAVDMSYIETYAYRFTPYSNARPTVYAIHNGYFYLRPVPDAVYTLNEYYFYKPSANLDSSDSPPFNGAADEALIAFTTGMALNRDERTQGRQDKIVSQLVGAALMLTGRRDKTLKRINAYRWEYEGLV